MFEKQVQCKTDTLSKVIVFHNQAYRLQRQPLHLTMLFTNLLF